MGNKSSATKLTNNIINTNCQQLPPPYTLRNEDTIPIETTKESNTSSSDILCKPVTADIIIKQRAQFKKEQLDAYENNYKDNVYNIIKVINKEMCDPVYNNMTQFAPEFIIHRDNITSKMPKLYINDDLTNTYMTKRVEFVREMYPDFIITFAPIPLGIRLVIKLQ